MLQKKRWVILKHLNAPDDPQKCHFDLLLEDLGSCRTWRLKKMPELNGECQEIKALPNHKLSWLIKKEAVLSKGRGEISREIAGFFAGAIPRSEEEPIDVYLQSEYLNAKLEIRGNLCKFISCK